MNEVTNLDTYTFEWDDEKAKKLGRGYNGILSRLLDMALSNPDMVKKCL